MQGRGDYRIRSAKRTEDDIDMEFEEQFKVSSQLPPKKREQTPGHYRKPIDSSQNSRLKDSRTGSAFGGGLGSRVGRVLRVSKSQKDKNPVADIEFNNVRWISIVSAYDSKRLKHVTVSKQSCEQFLKKYGHGVKKDPTASAYFKDVKKHFHSWLSKVNQTFVTVLNHFLTSTDKSPLIQLEKVNPVLEEIRYDTTMMKEKLESCLKYYENNDFRRMYTKFTDFYSFSSRLQQIIGIIFQKKEKIDSLFFELEAGGDIDKNLERIRKSGVKETKKLIYTDIKNTNLCDRIMEKVTHAINDMSTKGLSLFHKIQNAQLLITRIKKILADSHKKLTIKEIKKFSEIFHQVLDETQKFQEFVQQFDSESDFVTPELRQKIHFCREQLISKKRAVGEMQIIFVSTVINQTIDLLHSCHSLNTALTKQHTNYQQYNHLLDAIANCMLDETKKGITEGLIKQNRISFSRLQDQLEKISNSLKRHQEGFIIDTEDGQVASMECGKLTEHYKEKIKSLIKKHQDALRHLDSPLRDRKLPSNQKDPELIFLNKLVSISQTINNREWHNKVNHQKSFHETHSGIQISAKQIEKSSSILEQFESLKRQIEDLNNQNPLKDLIRIVRTQNGFYLQCTYFLNMLQMTSKTTERNVLQIVAKIGEISLKRKKQLSNMSHYKQTKAYSHLIDHIFCLILFKGLKKDVIKEIDDPKFLTFPENEYDHKKMQNEVKYRTLILQALGHQAVLCQKKLKSNISIMKDMINSKSLIDKLIKNENGQYIALTKVLSEMSIQMFKLCLLDDKKEGKSTEARRIVLELTKCLKSKSMNIDILEGQLDVQNHQASLRVRKEFIRFKNINEDALKELEKLSSIQDNDPLDSLSKTTHIIASYLHLTKQPVYLALNEWKQPIWIGTPDQSHKGLAQQIDLLGYPRGTFVTQYLHQPARIENQSKIKAVKPQSPPKKERNQEIVQKTSNIIFKEKSHPKDSMDQEILALESDKEIKDQMDEDIPDVPEDQFEMGQQIGDQMDEDFEQYEEDMKEEMGEQIGEEQKSREVKPPSQTFKQATQQDLSKNKENSQGEVSTYELIPFFRELEQIKDLVTKINHTDKQFWKENIDFQEIQDYFHRPQDLKDRNNFIKSLENCFSLFLGARFGPKLGEIVKSLDKLKIIKGTFLSLGEKNYNKIFDVLNISERNYSVLLNSGGEVVQIFSFDGDNTEFKKQHCRKCIYDFLQRQFKSSFFNQETFDFQGYITTCLTSQISELINQDRISFHYVIKYRAKCDESLPNSDTGKTLQSMNSIKGKFDTNFETGINLSYTCMQFWCKALDSNVEDCYKPDYSVLDGYVKQLSKIQHKESISHYLTQFKEQSLTLKSKIKQHKNTIDNLLFKVDNSNILECVESFANLYHGTPLNKLYFKKKSQKIILFISKEQSEGILTENPLTLLISHFFSKMMGVSTQNEISKQKIVQYVEKIYTKEKDDQIVYFMEFLNILEIQHFFTKQPHFLFKKNLQELVLGIFKEFGVTSIQQIYYDDLFINVFTIKKTTFSTEIQINKQIDQRQFSADFVKESKDKVENLSRQLQKCSQNFKRKVKDNDMSSVLIDFLKNKSSQNNLFNLILTYTTEIDEIAQNVIQISKKSQNLLNYLLSFEKTVKTLKQEIDSKISQVKSMKQSSLQLKVKKGDMLFVNQFFNNLKQWAKNVGLSKELTTYILTYQGKYYILNIQLSQSTDERAKSKEYLQTLLTKNWISDKKFQSSWGFIFEKYISKQIKIEIGAGGVSNIYYNLQESIKQIIEDLRLEIADPNNCIDFVNNFNLYRFCHSIKALQTANKCLTNINERFQLKQELLSVRKIVSNCNFQGLADYPLINSFLNCITQELDINAKSFEDVMEHTKIIKVKQTSLEFIKKWYSELCQDLLNLNYYQIHSSSEVVLCLLPVSKIDKDKSKNNKIISSFLSQINIDSNFEVMLEGQTQVVNLKPNPVKIVLKDIQKLLSKDDKMQDFKPEVPEGQMILFLIQQQDEKSTPLWISKLQLQTEVQLELIQFRSTVSLRCGYWRIGVEDYQQIKSKNLTTQEEKTSLQKKLRGLASPEEKIKDVKMGQQIFCETLGQWLGGQIKKYQHRVEEQQKAQQERLRLLQLKRKQQQEFIKQIKQELQKAQIPVMPFKNQNQSSENNNQPTAQIDGFFKIILTKYTKIIEKLEENKPTEELSRLQSIKKAYLWQLQKILSYNYQIQKKIIQKSQETFDKILKKRNEEQQRKKEQKAAKEKAKKQAETENPNSLNIQPEATGPLPEAPKPAQTKNDVVSQPEDKKNFDVIDLLLQKHDTNDAIQTFLIGWLQRQQPRDIDFYRCIIDEFYSLDKKEITSMTELK